jgi:hypothetical protein
MTSNKLKARVATRPRFALGSLIITTLLAFTARFGGQPSSMLAGVFAPPKIIRMEESQSPD